MIESNRRILLASRPLGKPTRDNFRLDIAPLAEPDEGQVLLKILYLSLDPYMRGRMNAGKSYAQPVEIGDVMEGGTVGRVVRSRHPDFVEGDVVLSHSGWQSFALADGSTLRKLDPATAPISTALGILGMPGFTAYAGLLTIGQPKPGETVVGRGGKRRCRIGGRADREDKGRTRGRYRRRRGQVCVRAR